MANYNKSLEAVDCHIHSVRYDMVLESRAGSWRPTQMPHGSAYGGVGASIPLTAASSESKMLLYYHGPLQ